MWIFADDYVKGDNCFCKSVSLPTLKPKTILDIINCSWCAIILEEDPSRFKRVFTVLNFCGPPSSQEDYKQHEKMENRIAISLREENLGQHFEHSKPKTTFIRRRQARLEEFNTLLENLCVACIQLVEWQLKSNHNPLIGYFIKKYVSSSHTTWVQTLSCKTARYLPLVNPHVHLYPASSVMFTRKHQLKLRSPSVHQNR